MDNKEKQRAALRTQACVDTTTLPLPTQLVRRRDADCDPVPTPVPEVFYPATGVPTPVPPPVYIIPTVLVGNNTQTVHCSDLEDVGPIGDNTVVEAYALTTVLVLEDIPGLSDAQGQFLSTLSDDTLAGILTADQSTLETTFLLTPSQATYVVDTIAGYLTALNAEALAIATAEIVCQWGNISKTATCSGTGALSTGTYDGQPAVFSVTVDANAVLSLISQDDANNQALVQAQAGLICVYGNTSQTQACYPDLGFTETVPTAGAGDNYPARVGSYTVSADTVFSLVSQDDANNLAKALAQTHLVCFYISDAVSATCAPDTISYGNDIPGTTTPYASSIPVSTSIAAGDYVAGIAGNPVDIPAGAVISEISTADATALAQALADGFSLCYWVSRSTTVTCPPLTIETDDGPIVYDPATSPTSPTYSVTVTDIISYISQYDADTQAYILATSGLDCMYCNKEVVPLCVPDGNPPPVTPGEVGSDWSRDATPGVAAGTFCEPDPTTAQQLAEQLGSIPIRITTQGGSSCTYGNDPIVAQCIQLAVDDVITVYGLFRTDGTPTNISGTDGSTAPGDKLGLSVNSKPDPYVVTNFVDIAADSVIVTIAEVPDVSPYSGISDLMLRAKTYANDQAVALARSFLDCYWDSQPVEVLCGAGDDAGSPVSGTIGDQSSTLVFGSGTAEAFVDDAYVSETVSTRAHGATDRPVLVAAKVFQSLVSQNAANQQSLELGILQLDCFWTNNAITETCQVQCINGEKNEDGSCVYPYSPSETKSPVYTTTVAADQIPSYVSQEDADAQATTLALAQLDCLYCNETIPAQCAGGTSLDQTAGIAADAVCTPDATTTLSVADAIAATLVRVQGHSTGAGDCTYGNDLVTASCLQVGAEPADPGDTEPSVVGMFMATTGLPYDGSGDNDPDEPDITLTLGPTSDGAYWGMSPASYPRPGTNITVAKNTVVVSKSDATTAGYSDPVAYANAQARLLARSQLDCFFSNEIRKYYCDGHQNDGGTYKPTCTGADDDGYYEFGTGTIFESGSLAVFNDTGRKPLQTDQEVLILAGGSTEQPFIERAVDPTSIGYKSGCGSDVKTPLIIPLNMFVSYTSRSDLNKQVRQYAASALDCFWRNQPLRILCGADEPVILEEDEATIDTTKAYYYGSGSAVNPDNDGAASQLQYASAVYPTAGTCECSSTEFLTFGFALVGGKGVPNTAIGSVYRPVIVPYGQEISKESLGAANEAAFQTGVTQLRCDPNNFPIWGSGCSNRVTGTMVPVRYFTEQGVLPSTAPSEDQVFYFDSNVIGPDNLTGGDDSDVSYLVNISHFNCLAPGSFISFMLNGSLTTTATGIILRTFGVLGSPSGTPYYAAIKHLGGTAPVEGDLLDTGDMLDKATAFQVVAPNSPSADSVTAQVSPNSYLLQSIDCTSQLTISGLGADFPIAAGNRIWLHCTLSGYSVTGAAIECDGNSDSWDFPTPVIFTGTGTTDDPYDQSDMYVLIAECKTPSSGDPPGSIFTAGSTSVRVIQSLTTNLLLVNDFWDGRVAVYVRPWMGASIL
jgi:hypothetical protein